MAPAAERSRWERSRWERSWERTRWERTRWERRRPACNEREARTFNYPQINADDTDQKR